MKTSFTLIKYKIKTPYEIIIHKINKIIFGKKKANDIIWKYNYTKLKKVYFFEGVWNFKGVILPDYVLDQKELLYQIYLDTLFVHCKHNDNYDRELIDKLDEILPEGAYFYKNNFLDVTVKEGDIIIDAGAWIGDFSALAALHGGTVYSFEPSKETFEYLCRTKELNRNIHVFKKALGSKSGYTYIERNYSNSGANKITERKENSEKIELHFLPPYSPNLNPIEKVWKKVKTESVHNKHFRTQEELQKNVFRRFNRIQGNPASVRNIIKPNLLGNIQ